MEPTEISLHLLKVFDAAKAHGGWISSKELAERAGVAGRTARKHARDLAAAGLFDVAAVFPENRYRLVPTPEQRNRALVERLERARSVFGI
jgi:DNA-binding IclR family transcriptional regulator